MSALPLSTALLLLQDDVSVILQEYYKQLVMELLSQQTESELYDRLVKAFEELTPPTLKLVIDRPNRVKFMKNFDKFLTNVRGFLCLK